MFTATTVSQPRFQAASFPPRHPNRNITILAVGTKMPRWVTEAVNEYSKRFGRDIHYTLKEIKPEKRGAGTSSAQGMAAEEKRILEALPPNAHIIALDERGKAPTSAGSKTAPTPASSSAAQTA